MRLDLIHLLPCSGSFELVLQHVRVKLCGWLKAITGDRIRQNIVGTVNPSDGQFVSLIVSHNDTAVLESFPDTLPSVPDQGQKAYLIPNNVNWHKSKSLNWQRIKSPYPADFINDLLDQQKQASSICALHLK